MIQVLLARDFRAIFHSIKPLLESKFKAQFTFETSLSKVLHNRKKCKSILIIRYFKGRYDKIEDNIKILSQLKEAYEKVAYFDDSDGADSLHFELLPYLDYYYKSQLYKDREHYYSLNLYGRQVFSNYYHKSQRIEDERIDNRPVYDGKVEDLNKIRVLWNLGVTNFPISNKRRLLLMNTPFFQSHLFGFRPFYRSWSDIELKSNNETKINKVHARFDFKAYSNTIGFQRKMILDTIQGNDLYISGRVKRNKFYEELQSVTAVLSPFGWGEICYRDFESISFGCLLIKPDMSDIETYPNIYKPQTYLPIKWDGSDLISEVEEVMADEGRIQCYVNNAAANYNSEISNLGSVVERLINEIS